MSLKNTKGNLESMEWSNEITMKFLDLYAEERLLWDASHGLHANRDAISEAWKRIQENLGNEFSVDQLKRKKTSLLASYRHYRRKIAQSRSSGAEESTIYKPNWFAYKKMENFLKNKNKPKETIFSKHIPLQEEVLNKEILTSGANTESLPSGIKVGIKMKNEANELQTILHGACDIMKSSMDEMNKDKDMLDIYGELMVAKLRDLDETTREILMHKFDALLHEEKVKKIKKEFL